MLKWRVSGSVSSVNWIPGLFVSLTSPSAPGLPPCPQPHMASWAELNHPQSPCHLGTTPRHHLGPSVGRMSQPGTRTAVPTEDWMHLSQTS